MARAVRRDTLRTRVRYRCDIEGETTRFPNAELNDAINEGIAKLHSRIVRARGAYYYESTSNITTSQGVEEYVLPATFLQLLKVHSTFDGAEVVFTPYEFVETDGYTDTAAWGSGLRPQYRLRGANISFRPIPDDSYVVTLTFVPTAIQLDDDAETVDGVDGLEEYVVAWAGKRVAMKQRDWNLAGQLDMEMDRAFQELDGLIHSRDAVLPPRMLDVKSLDTPRRRSRRR